MRLSQEFKIASELREKVHLAEDQLRNEKKNLIRAEANFSEEKEKWAAELKEKELIISSNEAEIKEKEARYKETREKCIEISHRSALIEAENEALRKELQRLKLQKDDDMCKFLVEEGNLELELAKIEDWRKDVKVSDKWKKALQSGGPGEGISSNIKKQFSLCADKSPFKGEVSTTKAADEGAASQADEAAEEAALGSEKKESGAKEIDEEMAFLDKLQ